MIKEKNILLGVTGGIAAYKALELTRLLVKRGCNVTVLMTDGAQRFVTPLSFETLSGNPVFLNLFDNTKVSPTTHIELAEKADIMVIAPATGNIIGKIACGVADNLLTTVVMATTAPVLIAPAMNVNMYDNPIVQGNIKKLRDLGYRFIGPEDGELACGYEGRGRMSEPVDIEEAIIDILSNKDLKGERIVVTAGPTREFLDPIRFISNPSTGKMGFWIARMARRRGAEVSLISGPTSLRPPYGVEFVEVTTAMEMREEVLMRFDQARAIIMTAAVGDFYPSIKEGGKIKRRDTMVLELQPTPDILKELGERKGNQILIGFAAETDNVIKSASKKLIEKRLDLIVANDVNDPDSGFGKDTNRVVIIDKRGIEELPLLTKEEVAYRVLDRLLKML